MSIELVGRFQEALQPQKLKGRDGGEISKQDFIIEVEGKFPKKVCITMWNDKAAVLTQLKNGQELKVQVEIESREYNGRWYTNITGWKVEQAGNEPAQGVPAHTPADIPQEKEDDDLPF